MIEGLGLVIFVIGKIKLWAFSKANPFLISSFNLDFEFI